MLKLELDRKYAQTQAKKQKLEKAEIMLEKCRHQSSLSQTNAFVTHTSTEMFVAGRTSDPSAMAAITSDGRSVGPASTG